MLFISENSQIHVVLSSFSVSQVRISPFCKGLDPPPTKHNDPKASFWRLSFDYFINSMRARWRQRSGGNVKHSSGGREGVVDDFILIP